MQAVVLNMCFDYEATRLLGVENHVCELQFVVRGIHDVQVSPLVLIIVMARSLGNLAAWQ